MHIFQITPTYLPTIGGVQKVVSELSYELAKIGHKVTIFTGYSRKDDRRVVVKEKNLKTIFLKSLEIAHTPIIPSLFFKLIKIPKKSVMHVHVAKAFVPEIVYLISKLRKIPYVVHFHLDVDPSGTFGFLLPIYKKYFLRRVLLSASKIIVFSKIYRELLEKKYSITKNIVEVPNGVGDEFFVNRKNLSKKTTDLLYVGRVSSQKQVDILVNALKYIKSNVTLHIVGDGDLLPKITRLIKKNRQKNVVLHGAKFGNELIEVYKRSDIFLLSSKKEGLPLVVLEAMAAGLPVIVSDVIGSHEFVGDTGVLVNPPTPKKFATAIDKVVINKKLRNSLSKKSIEKAKKYRWGQIAHKIEKIYVDIQNEN